MVCHVVQEAAAKEEQWQKRADQREQDRLVREARKQRQQQVSVGTLQNMTSVQDSPAKLADSCLTICLTASFLCEAGLGEFVLTLQSGFSKRVLPLDFSVTRGFGHQP